MKQEDPTTEKEENTEQRGKSKTAGMTAAKADAKANLIFSPPSHYY